MKNSVPVITVDGPGGSGKGTLSRQLARFLGWHFLDSGALYRLVALAALKHAVPFESPSALTVLATHLDVVFMDERVLLEGSDVSGEMRTEECANAASKVAAIPAVREALLARQRAFLELPGLVADGRDMGTVVFPEAKLKIFLEASPMERAQRRQAQLKEQGLDVSLDGLFAEIVERDTRDRQRTIAPLVPAEDALIIDTTKMTIPEVFAVVKEHARQRGLLPNLE